MAKAKARTARKAKMARNDEYGAQTRGQTLVYSPNDLTLVEDPSHPLYDPSVHVKWDEATVRGMLEFGVMEPIVIRRNGTDRAGRAIIEVVDGRTRVINAREALRRQKASGVDEKDWVVVPAVLRKGMKDADAESAMIILNTHRRVEQLITQADKLKRYLAHGHTEAQAKLAFKVKTSGFKVLMDVMEMGPAVKEALRDKKVTLAIARNLAALPESKQSEALAETLKEGGGRGEKATAASAKATESRGSKPRKTPLRPKSYKQIMKAIDTVACMPRDAVQTARLEALEWAAGKRQVNWSGESA